MYNVGTKSVMNDTERRSGAMNVQEHVLPPLAGLAWASSPQLAYAPLSAEANAKLRVRLQRIAQEKSEVYGCKIAVGMQTAMDSIAVADKSTNADADRFVWGSITKLITGSAVLRSVERGDLKDLDVPVHKIINPMLKRLGLGPMEELFGWTARFITARHLGSMRSG